MVGMEVIYAGLGLFFFYTAYSAVRHGAWRRATVGGFWGLYGLIFISGSALGDFANGLIIIGMTILAVCMRTLPSVASNRHETAVVAPEVIGGRAVQPDMMRLFLPLLVVPVVAVLFVFIAPWLQWHGQSLFDPQRTNQIGYVLATLAGLVVACWWLRPPAGLPFAAGSALVQRVGWPLVLPQILAMLGGVYMAAGVNHQLGALLMAILPSGNALVAVLGYTTGMMLVSALVGNAFAAFPILFGALGLPVLVGTFGLSPAPVAAVGMLCGFSGTLLTPMAVNFNIVPVSLLGLKDRFAVIRAQMPAAFFVFVGNSLLLYTLTFFKGHSSP